MTDERLDHKFEDESDNEKSDVRRNNASREKRALYHVGDEVQMDVDELDVNGQIVQTAKRFFIHERRYIKGSNKWQYQLREEDHACNGPNPSIMATRIPTTSNKRESDEDLEKGLALVTDPLDDSDKICGLSSPTTTAVDNASDCSEKSEASEASSPYIITKALETFPIGYPLQAAFQSSESSFSIYRSFGYLHSRVILELQDELRLLEDNLEKLDGRDSSREERRDCVTSREADLMQAKRDRRPSERANLLTQICDTLMRYDGILLKVRELNAFQRPSNRDYGSLRNWFENECLLSSEAEMEYVKRKEDLITLRQGREWAGFDGWIESSIKKLPRGLSRKLFTTPELRAKTKNKCINYFAPARIEKLVGLIITLVIFVLLILPVVAMYKLTSVGEQNSTIKAVGILVVFTLLFSAAMSFVTRAKRHELFAASAAYCAVLVVFISNFGNNGTSLSVSRGGGVSSGA